MKTQTRKVAEKKIRKRAIPQKKTRSKKQTMATGERSTVSMVLSPERNIRRIFPGSRSFKAVLRVLPVEAHFLPERWDNGPIDQPIRASICQAIANHKASMRLRIKAFTETGGGNVIHFARQTAVTWTDFQALINSALIACNRGFKLDDFETILSAWTMQEVAPHERRIYESWSRQGGIYGPGSTLGKWFAQNYKPTRQFEFLRHLIRDLRLVNMKMEVPLSDMFDAQNRVKLALQLIRSMLASSKQERDIEQGLAVYAEEAHTEPVPNIIKTAINSINNIEALWR